MSWLSPGRSWRRRGDMLPLSAHDVIRVYPDPTRSSDLDGSIPLFFSLVKSLIKSVGVGTRFRAVDEWSEGCRSDRPTLSSRSRPFPSPTRAPLTRPVARIEVRIPDLGEASPQALLCRWRKAVGDRVVAGDVLAEAQTDKVDLEIAADVDGWLTAIHVPAGAPVVAGEVIAAIETAPGILSSAPVAPPAPPGVPCLRCGAPMEPARTSAPALSVVGRIRFLVCRACGRVEMVAEDPATL